MLLVLLSLLAVTMKLLSPCWVKETVRDQFPFASKIAEVPFTETDEPVVTVPDIVIEMFLVTELNGLSVRVGGLLPVEGGVKVVPGPEGVEADSTPNTARVPVPLGIIRRLNGSSRISPGVAIGPTRAP